MPLAFSLFALVAASLCLEDAGAVVSVHLVPHTHDDVGWLKTVDQYYAGLNNTIQHAYVRMIIDTVIGELRADPNRTFTYVEQAFFQRWWRQQDDATKDAVSKLVKSGQLSFANGGWCMHDEATPFYLDMIDQTTLGHRFLMDEFGRSPTIGWQLDPFGHSSTQAALLSAEVGLVGLFFARIDYQDLALRSDPSNRAAEFIWRASPSLGDDAQVFTGLTGQYSGTYGPPVGFHFDSLVSEADPFQDDPDLMDYNVKTIVDEFVDKALWQANRTRGENIMWTMGDDFNYESAHEWFFNMDRLIKYVNRDGRVRALYSTPEKYVKAKAAETSVSWPLKTDDFFPYADGPHHFWTGYFTSRPAFKRFVRDTSSFLQVVRQILAIAVGPTAYDDKHVQSLAEAQGVAQHHDAVSGTAKQHVTFDYARRLSAGRSAAQHSTSEALGGLAGGEGFRICELRNVSVCQPTQDGGDLEVLLWNGLAQDRSELVELPAPTGAGFKIVDKDGKQVPQQTVPSLPSITNYGRPAGGSSSTILFKANVPALGYEVYKLTQASERAPDSKLGPIAAISEIQHKEPDSPVVLENDYLALHFVNNNLEAIVDKETGITKKMSQSWLYYEGSTGNAESDQVSGAYIFRPNSTAAKPIVGGAPNLTLVQGSLASEVHQTFGSWISQRIRLANDSRHAEITYTVGPIPIGDLVGKEIISRFSTNISNHGECSTDSNGREMLPRQRDWRQSWKLNQTEPVAGNYYPVTSAISIRDTDAQLTLLTDVAQGGSGCIRDGELEMMVHRDLLVDDNRGVGEPLNETEFITPYVGRHQGQHYGRGLVVRGRHFLSLSKPADAAKQWRPLQDRLYMDLLPFFPSSAGATQRKSYTALAKALPKNVQLVTLQPWDKKFLLLRLAHQFGKGEDADLSGPVTFNLKGLFTGQDILEVQERGLAGTISRDEVLSRRISWKVDGEERQKPLKQEKSSSTDLDVTLGPLQIRTFLVKLSPVPSTLVV